MVSEERKTEERRGTGFSVLAAPKMGQKPKNEKGGNGRRTVYK